MGELARRSRMSKQTMTTMVRLAERDGLVRRERDPSDARATLVHLTERGHELRPVAAGVLAELEGRVRRLLGAEGLSELRRSLKGVMEL